MSIVGFLLQIVAGYFMADIIIGAYHWVKDTYFSPFTPVIGNRLIWSSRLHHIRPKFITQFSDSEIFFDSALYTALWFIPCSFLFGISPFSLAIYVTICFNDVIHKYSHTDQVPPLVKMLQWYRIIQGNEEHRQHHLSPHEINYCPITCFTNPILEHFSVWRKLESLIEKHLGFKPRVEQYEVIEDCHYPAGIKFVQTP